MTKCSGLERELFGGSSSSEYDENTYYARRSSVASVAEDEKTADQQPKSISQEREMQIEPTEQPSVLEESDPEEELFASVKGSPEREANPGKQRHLALVSTKKAGTGTGQHQETRSPARPARCPPKNQGDKQKVKGRL